MTVYAMYAGHPRRPAWVAIIKEADHGLVLWTGSVRHQTMRDALAEADAKREKLMKESA